MKQDALADVIETARLVHELRGLAAEVEGLLAQAMVVAADEGLTKAIIAEAAGVTPGRVSQIVSATAVTSTGRALRDRIHKITNWPGDALGGHRATFAGRMTFPPYSRRRSASSASATS